MRHNPVPRTIFKLLAPRLPEQMEEESPQLGSPFVKMSTRCWECMPSSEFCGIRYVVPGVIRAHHYHPRKGKGGIYAYDDYAQALTYPGTFVARGIAPHWTVIEPHVIITPTVRLDTLLSAICARCTNTVQAGKLAYTDDGLRVVCTACADAMNERMWMKMDIQKWRWKIIDQQILWSYARKI